MRKTKIVATLGPASESEEVIARLIEAGADAFRFNFSHGTREEHGALYARVREAGRRMGTSVALIQDLQGPKIRVGALKDGAVELIDGAQISLTSREVEGDAELIPVRYPPLEQDVRPGETILMDDGKIRLEVLSKDETALLCTIIEGGTLKPHKGVNFPGSTLSMPSITTKDMEDLRFGMETGFDAVALSFVSQAADVLSLRDEMKRIGIVRPIIAKLERAAALADLPAILKVSDGVMVARGDLGVEMDIWRVPVLQKRIIREANLIGIPVITATQMLESMTIGLLPTRAEVADVANAVYDGTDAIMLSGETSVGKYPVQAVHMMRDIAVEAEAALDILGRQLWMDPEFKQEDIPTAVCHTAVIACHDLGLQNIVVITRSGRTARDIARFRPTAAIHAFSFSENVNNFLRISHGVVPYVSERADDFEELLDLIDTLLLEKNIGKNGDGVAVVLGVPIAVQGTTNLLMIHRIGRKYGRRRMSLA